MAFNNLRKAAFLRYKAEIRPCEDILCPVDIPEKRAKWEYLMVSTGILNVLKPCNISKVFKVNDARNMEWISFKRSRRDIYSSSLISIGFTGFHVVASYVVTLIML